jgi:hypothetical protein
MGESNEKETRKQQESNKKATRKQQASNRQDACSTNQLLGRFSSVWLPACSINQKAR